MVSARRLVIMEWKFWGLKKLLWGQDPRISSLGFNFGLGFLTLFWILGVQDFDYVRDPKPWGPRTRN